MSRIFELSNFCLHTEYRGQSRVFFFFSCPELSNYRILSSHGISWTVTDFLSRIIEFYILVPRLVLCPELSNYRISITRIVTEYHGFSFFFLSRIIEFLSSHGVSRTVTDFLFSFLSRIIEFYLSCPETCPWTH